MDSFASKFLIAAARMISTLAPKIYTRRGYFSRPDNPGTEGDVFAGALAELMF